MIKANELRVGNFVNSHFLTTNFCDIVLEITGTSVTVLDGKCKVGYSYENIDPIPLTPAILEKAGFKKESTIHDNHWDGDLIILQEELGGYAVFASEWTIGRPCFYLHQLQNLHFALTGEELKINV